VTLVQFLSFIFPNECLTSFQRAVCDSRQLLKARKALVVLFSSFTRLKVFRRNSRAKRKATRKLKYFCGKGTFRRCLQCSRMVSEPLS